MFEVFEKAQTEEIKRLARIEIKSELDARRAADREDLRIIIEGVLDAKLAPVNHNIVELGQRMSNIEQRMSDIEQRMSNIESDIKEIKQLLTK